MNELHNFQHSGQGGEEILKVRRRVWDGVHEEGYSNIKKQIFEQHP